jgi:hypothetical protein
MTGTIIFWTILAGMAVTWIQDAREEARRRKRDPQRERMRRLYAQRRKRKWQPLPKRAVRSYDWKRTHHKDANPTQPSLF